LIRLIVFLGNPGKEHERTRHNVRWMVADSLSFAHELAWKEKFKGLFATHRGATYLKPTTFMNRSGESVVACTAFYRIGPEELLVVHDDMELAFERVELRHGGGLGGHKGLKDIVRVLGTKDFERLRFGISRPARGTPSEHVLGRFSPDEEAVLPDLLRTGARLIEDRVGK
jgi:PTH1 family peptidyl-tRNA hydrolase